MARIFVTSRQLCLGGWCQFDVCLFVCGISLTSSQLFNELFQTDDGCYNIMISQPMFH